VLGDFGLARGPASTVLTRAGQVLGSVDYLAPELIEGAPGGPAADVYALGCLAVACLAGAPPFAGRRPFETTVAHLAEHPAEPGGRPVVGEAEHDHARAGARAQRATGRDQDRAALDAPELLRGERGVRQEAARVAAPLRRVRVHPHEVELHAATGREPGA